MRRGARYYLAAAFQRGMNEDSFEAEISDPQAYFETAFGLLSETQRKAFEGSAAVRSRVAERATAQVAGRAA